MRSLLLATAGLVAGCGSAPVGSAGTAGTPGTTTVPSGSAPAPFGTPTWSALPPSPLTARTSTAVWTGAEMVVFGGEGPEPGFDGTTATTTAKFPPPGSPPSGSPPREIPVTRAPHVALDGAAYDPAHRTWRSLPALAVPDGRTPVVVATEGPRLTVLFGSAHTCAVDDPAADPAGAYLDPGADGWVTIPRGPLVPPCTLRGAWFRGRLHAWAGSGAVVAAFDPASGSWTALPTQAPSAGPGGLQHLHVVGDLLVDTGISVAADGGSAAPYARAWDPDGASWVALPRPPVEPRSVAGSGGRLFVYDGFQSRAGVFDSTTRSWRLLPDVPVATRSGNVALADGGRFVVWGGHAVPRRAEADGALFGYTVEQALGDGAVYDAGADAWRTIVAPPDAPDLARDVPAAVLTPDRLLVWGGRAYERSPDQGRITTRVLDDGADLPLP